MAANALRNQRSEIAGAKAPKQQKIDALRASLVHIDATLKLFDPDLISDDLPAKVK